MRVMSSPKNHDNDFNLGVFQFAPSWIYLKCVFILSNIQFHFFVQTYMATS